ncbi:MAG: polyribonucleotide nucleotidyltransferase [Armatimonadota bacterium]|nr:MAG: polyribonucleotide nucleotidyltransferase [Armatimonadota bacterium]
MAIVNAAPGGRELSLEAGSLARQANGAVVVRQGDSIVLATVAASEQPREGISFFPLTCDYEEKLYAAGRIPGSRFIKREGRPSEQAIVTARRIDRPLRPLFPKHVRNEVQVIVTVLSADLDNIPDILGMVGASAALTISDIPFDGPVGSVRVARVDGELLLNPTYEQRDMSDLELVIAGTREGVIMVEGAAQQVPEDVIAAAIERGRDATLEIIEAQERLRAQMDSPPKREIPVPDNGDIVQALAPYAAQLRDAVQSPDKKGRERAMQDASMAVIGGVLEQFPERYSEIAEQVDQVIKQELRRLILDEGRRPDGRRPDELRPLESHVGLLPRAHGSGLFTRGQTQVLSIVTLGGTGEEQIVDALPEERTKRFMHHYNFPPYSVGETRPLRGPSRRDVGHGNLVERAIGAVLPPEDEFPYTIRVVSEVLESNGSSSMASACATTLGLMDAGVPIVAPVAGISIGMVSDDSRYVLLTDIQGVEDFNGDMDFKIAGTRDGVTAVQMDVKRGGLSRDVLHGAMEQGRRARLQILDHMATTLAAPRPELAPHAPRIFVIEVHPDKIGDIIGPGGKIIKKIEADFGVKVDIEQDGRVFIAATDAGGGNGALKTIEDLTRDITIGETYVGKVVRVTYFGAFVELLPGRDGLIHISQLARERVERVEDVVNVGDEVMVKVIDIDPQGKVRLTRKGLLPGGEETEERRPSDDRRRPSDDRRRRRR